METETPKAPASRFAFELFVPRYYEGNNPAPYPTGAFQALERAINKLGSGAYRGADINLIQGDTRVIRTPYRFSVETPADAGQIVLAAFEIFKDAKRLALFTAEKAFIIDKSSAMLMALGESPWG